VPADHGPPSDEVLAALVASLCGELAQARAELARAREWIAELEAQLRQTPRNSSRPPSGEGLGKPPPRPRSLRKKSGRTPGGQDGHQGATLAQVARPDREVRHEPGCCGRCGRSLAGRPVTGVDGRQVFDLPAVKIEVIEHQLIERECWCGRRTKPAPKGAEAPVCYGPRIAAIIVYLYVGQFLSKRRTAQALAELFGVRCRPARSPPSPLALPGNSMVSWSGPVSRSPPAPSRASTRPGSGWRGSWPGCTAPAPPSTAC
jgi:transposase